MRIVPNSIIALFLLILCSCAILPASPPQWPTEISQVQPSADSRDPGGFRNIKWGTKLETLPDMVYSFTEPRLRSDIKSYTRKGDKMAIGAAHIKKILYKFWEGKFVTAVIWTSGDTNCSCLKAAAFARYGKVRQVNESIQESKPIEEYYWEFPETWIKLEYNRMGMRSKLILIWSELSELFQQAAWQQPPP